MIGRMIGDLNLPIELHVAPTVREADGLAMSSRNRRLDLEQRQTAPHSSGPGCGQCPFLGAGT